MHTAAGQSRKEAQVFSWAQKQSGSCREGAENDNGAWAVKCGVGGGGHPGVTGKRRNFKSC